MTQSRIIVIGASAGGVEATMQLIRGLPASLNASIFITIHIPSHSTSLLPELFSRVSAMPVMHPQNMQSIERGTICVAPPDYHLMVRENHVEISKGAKVNNSRPSIDRLFDSAAISHKQNVIGVVLTGLLDDGSMGLARIKHYGGITIAQDPEEALYPQMPLNAIHRSACDYVLRLSEISKLLIDLVESPLDTRDAAMKQQNFDVSNKPEKSSFSDQGQTGDRIYEKGKASVYSCPDCGGVLSEIYEDGILGFVCRVGHSYSVEWLLAMQKDNVEKALWAALRSMDESISLARNIAEQEHDESLKGEYEEKADDYERQAHVLRNLLLK